MPRRKIIENTKTEKNALFNNKSLKRDFIVGVGRRKEAVAGVRLYENKVTWGNVEANKGEIVVNGKKGEEYFGSNLEALYKKPLSVTNTENKFAITARVRGGGKAGQVEAIVLGLARALDKYDKEKFHSLLKKKGLLTRDSRVRERRKVGMGGKARRRKQSPKR